MGRHIFIVGKIKKNRSGCKMSDYHTQCLLCRGNTKYSAWIPTKYAVLNEFISIKDKGNWEDGWKVIAVYGTLPTETVLERSQDYKKTRKASDI